MSDGALTKIAAEKAAEVATQNPLGEEANRLLNDTLNPKEYLDLLIEKGYLLDAIHFLAHALPKREAVWWACLCCRQGCVDPPELDLSALQAAEKWVIDPSEDHRRAAMRAAETAEFSTAAACAAVAAFWSEGSMAPPELPAVPPGEQLTGHGAAGAVLLAAVASEPEKAAEKHGAFLQLGLDIAMGINKLERLEGEAPAGP